MCVLNRGMNIKINGILPHEHRSNLSLTAHLVRTLETYIIIIIVVVVVAYWLYAGTVAPQRPRGTRVEDCIGALLGDSSDNPSFRHAYPLHLTLLLSLLLLASVLLRLHVNKHELN
jgi:hypothetical protein